MKDLRKNLPLLYFAALWLFIGVFGLIRGERGGIGPVLLATGFIGLIVYNRKSLNLLTGILMFFWSILILFAYLSDASKLDSTALEAWRFLFFGGLISVLNFLMSYLMCRNSFFRRTPEIA